MGIKLLEIGESITSCKKAKKNTLNINGKMSLLKIINESNIKDI